MPDGPVTASTDAPPPPTKPAAGSFTAGRRRLALIAVPAVALLAALVWLFGSEGAAPEPPAQLSDLPVLDGTLNVVESGRLVMTPFEPLDGQTSVEFSVPEQYQGNFDLAHLRSHSSVGIPTRIYYLERDGDLLAVYKDDAPVNSAPAPDGE